MSVRRYTITAGTSVSTVVEICDKEFVPLVSRHPDFISYYAIISGGNEYFSVSVFFSQSGAEESVKLAQRWTEQHLKNKIKLIETIEGHTVVEHDSFTQLYNKHAAD